MAEQAVQVYQEQPVRRFNPNDHIIQIPNKKEKQDYLPVQWRLVWFRELCPQGTIETELVLLDLDRETEEEAYVWNNDTKRSEKIMKRANGIAVFKAVVTDGKGGKAEAYKSEKAASFGDFIEKANTGAVGRALAMLGYGTQFAEMELSEEDKIVDAPVERKPAPRPYTERKPFVEGSVSVNAEQPPAQSRDQALHDLAKPGPARMSKPLTNGDGSEAKPRSYSLDEVKALFAKLYKPERWTPFVVRVLGMPVDDEGLSDSELGTLHAALVEARKSMAR